MSRSRPRDLIGQYVPPPPRIIAMNHLYHLNFTPNALQHVAVYVHPLMQTLQWVIATLRTAGAMIIFVDSSFPHTLQTTQPYNGPILTEHYLLVPLPSEFDMLPRLSHSLSKTTIGRLAPWAIQVSSTFLDTRLQHPNVRPSHHALFQPLPFTLPIPNFPSGDIIILGPPSALVRGYQYFCEAAKDRPGVYDRKRHYNSAHKPRMGRVDIVVLVDSDQRVSSGLSGEGGLIDFEGDGFWHSYADKHANSTPYNDIDYLAYRQRSPVFVSEGWIEAVLESATAGVGPMPSLQPFIIPIPDIRKAILAYQIRPQMPQAPRAHLPSRPILKSDLSNNLGLPYTPLPSPTVTIHSPNPKADAIPALQPESAALPTPPPTAIIPLPTKSSFRRDFSVSVSSRLTRPTRDLPKLSFSSSDADSEGATPPRIYNRKRKGSMINHEVFSTRDKKAKEAKPKDEDEHRASPFSPQEKVVSVGLVAGLVWHYVEVIMTGGMDMVLVLNMLQSQFEDSDRYFTFVPARRIMYATTSSAEKYTLVLKIGTTVDNGFSLATKTIMQAFQDLVELHIVDDEGKDLFMRRGT